MTKFNRKKIPHLNIGMENFNLLHKVVIYLLFGLCCLAFHISVLFFFLKKLVSKQ